MVPSTPRSAPLYVYLYILINKCFVDMSIAPIIPQRMPIKPAVSFSRPKASSGLYSSLLSPPFYAAAILIQITPAIENAIPMKCNGLIFSLNFRYMITMLNRLATEVMDEITPWLRSAAFASFQPTDRTRRKPKFVKTFATRGIHELHFNLPSGVRSLEFSSLIHLPVRLR